jgi:calcineurin-like phosphoesterase family protein
MTTWFTSDLHFGHKFLADLRKVGRDKLDEHDEKVIEAWNSVVGDDDEVWVLGDFSFWKRNKKPEKTAEIFGRLKGRRKHLIVGNHDESDVLELGWDSVGQLSSVTVEGAGMVLCHYPLVVWDNSHHGVFHLHGHTHGNLREDLAKGTTRMDVGIDGHPEFRPYSLEEVLEEMGRRTYEYVDHHNPALKSREDGK